MPRQTAQQVPRINVRITFRTTFRCSVRGDHFTHWSPSRDRRPSR